MYHKHFCATQLRKQSTKGKKASVKPRRRFTYIIIERRIYQEIFFERITKLEFIFKADSLLFMMKRLIKKVYRISHRATF